MKNDLELRKESLAKVKRLVIKIGSKILVAHEQSPNKINVNEAYIDSLVQSILLVRSMGIEVVLVSSGAVGVGMSALGLKKRPKQIGRVQACASIGQVLLMEAYQKALTPFGVQVGQILLSADDFRNRDRYKNIKNTVKSLLKEKALPIINENDTIAVEEIKVGDNDKLSADVAHFLEAQLLIIFTDEKGLFDSNPKSNPEAKLLKYIPEINDEILALAEGAKGSEVSTGGMQTKLEALRQATSAGCSAILAHGHEVLPHQLVEGQDLGSFFKGCDDQIGSRERWLGLVSSPSGWVEIDAGAQKALLEDGSSLLLMGINSVHGHFRAGELLEIRSHSGKAIARGASNVDVGTLRELLGLSDEEQHELDKKTRVVVHRNNLVISI